MEHIRSKKIKFLTNAIRHPASWIGSPRAYIFAVGFTFVWLVSDPAVHLSEYWKLIIKITGGAVTFITVFLIQRSQDKGALAMQIKLNEIIAAINGANNRMINIENLSEGEINSLQKDYENLASLIHKDNETSTHAVSVEEVISQLEDAMLAEEAIR